MSTLKVDNLLNSAGNESPISVPGAAKAWGNFDGSSSDISSTVNGFNINSITDNGDGDYTVNFTNNLANANYAVVGGAHQSTSAGNLHYVYSLSSQPNALIGGTYYTTSSARLVYTWAGYQSNAAPVECARAMFVVYGD